MQRDNTHTAEVLRAAGAEIAPPNGTPKLGVLEKEALERAEGLIDYFLIAMGGTYSEKVYSRSSLKKKYLVARYLADFGLISEALALALPVHAAQFRAFGPDDSDTKETALLIAALRARLKGSRSPVSLSLTTRVPKDKLHAPSPRPRHQEA